MKKRMSFFTAIICLVLTACSNNEPPIEEKTEQEEIVLWSYYETEKQKASMDELVDGFNAFQDKYRLRWEYHGPASEFEKELAISITQNQLPDMVILDNPEMLSHIKMDDFEDITSYIQEMEGLDQYYQKVLDSVIYEGRYYGLPFCCNNLGLIYNKDILEQEGILVPKNWEELKAAAEKLTNEERYGLAVSAIGGEQCSFQFASFMLSAGDDLQDAGGTGTRKAYQLMNELVEKGWMSRECVNWSQNDVGRTFISGECAMMINGPWVLPALNDASINYGVALFPMDERRQVILGGEDIAILKGKNVEGSIAFFKYYNSRDVMLKINMMANSLPPRRDVAQVMLSVKPEYRMFLSQLNDCVNRTGYAKWPELSEQLSDGQYQILTGQKDVETVCRLIKETLNDEQGGD